MYYKYFNNFGNIKYLQVILYKKKHRRVVAYTEYLVRMSTRANIILLFV